jgi:hypothetical protein
VNGQELIGPVQWIVDVIQPLLFWTGVQADWLQNAALNVVLITSFIAKLAKWTGWKVLALAGGWGVLYAAAEYSPSIVTVIAGGAAVFLMTSLAMKAGKLIRAGGERMMPLAKPSRRGD